MSRESKPAPSMVSPYRMNHTILSSLWFGSGLDSPPPIVLYTRASLSEIRFSFSLFAIFFLFSYFFIFEFKGNVHIISSDPRLQSY